MSVLDSILGYIKKDNIQQEEQKYWDSVIKQDKEKHQEAMKEYNLLHSQIKDKGIFGKQVSDEMIQKITDIYYTPHFISLKKKNENVESINVWKDMKEKGFENIILLHNAPMKKEDIILLHHDFIEKRIDENQLSEKRENSIDYAQAELRGENPHIAKWIDKNQELVKAEGLQDEKKDIAFSILYTKGFIKDETMEKAMEYESKLAREEKKTLNAEYKLFEKPSNFKDLHNSYTQDIMVESWDKDRCNGIGGVVFNTSLNPDQYLVLFYVEVDKALKKGRNFEEVMEVAKNGGLNTLMPQNGSTKEDFQKYCNDFIEKQKEAGQQIKYPKILEEQKQEKKATQKRVSPQVRAEMEKKAQRQGIGR